MARQGYFEKEKIRTIDWPAPNLSPIENVWAFIKNRLFESGSEITKWKDLITMIDDIFWRDKTLKEAIKNGYESLPYGIENMLSRKGEGTAQILSE